VKGRSEDFHQRRIVSNRQFFKFVGTTADSSAL